MSPTSEQPDCRRPKATFNRCRCILQRSQAAVYARSAGECRPVLPSKNPSERFGRIDVCIRTGLVSSADLAFCRSVRVICKARFVYGERRLPCRPRLLEGQAEMGRQSRSYRTASHIPLKKHTFGCTAAEHTSAIACCTRQIAPEGLDLPRLRCLYLK